MRKLIRADRTQREIEMKAIEELYRKYWEKKLGVAEREEMADKDQRQREHEINNMVASEGNMTE